jgi:acetyl-CoA carboxylase carboxyltransferase component
MRIGGTEIPEHTTSPMPGLLQAVPVVGVAPGACAGQGAIKALSSHFSVLVREQARLMAAGPPGVRRAYGAEVDKNDLRGWKAHRKSALVHNEAADEAVALAQAKRFLSCLPRSVDVLAPVLACDDAPGRAEDWPKDAIPHNWRKIYGSRRTLNAVFDHGSLFGLPVLNFVDQPGNATGLEAGFAGKLLGATRWGKALAACRSA